RTLRRAVVLAAALLVLAAGIAVAGRLGLPGVRVIFSKTPPTVAPTSPPPTQGSPAPSVPGSTLGLGDRVTLQEARGSGSYPGLWITGAPHEVYYLGPGGGVEQDTVRLSTDVLIWQEGGVILRLEGAQSLAQAVRVADSMG